MTENLSATIFESFNAKALTPEQVADTFVPPPFFKRLLKRRHTIIVGPRGSGKTTLLKMLQQPAIETWEHEKASQYAARIDFNSVFVPTDLRWSRQLESLGEGKLDKRSKQLFSVAAFTTHVLRGLAITFLNRTRPPNGEVIREHRRVTLDSRVEEMVVRSIAEAWRAEPQISSFLSLRQSLTKRLADLRWLAQREAALGDKGRQERLQEYPFLFLSFLDSATVGIELFNDAVGAPDSRWAFAFDELELAPEVVRDELTNAIRSADERFLFKLALSPSSDQGAKLESALVAAPGHDYDPIRLWYVHRSDGIEFCEALWYAMLEDRNLPPREPSEVLGLSKFESPKGNAYEQGSKWGELFADMAEQDPTFRSYLQKRGINPNDLSRISGTKRAATIRKVAPVLRLRAFYGKPGQKDKVQRQFRSRKKPTVYTGAASLFAITEGNPRWFIGMIGSLLDQLDEKVKVEERAQADEIKKAAQRFSALLRTTPTPTIKINHKNCGALDIIGMISDYFAEKHIIKEFTAEPPATVVVDSNVPDDLDRILRSAINVGALVYVPNNDSEVLLTTLKGKRFRVSYLLAPLYKLPVRLGKEVSLSTILRGEESPGTIPLGL